MGVALQVQFRRAVEKGSEMTLSVDRPRGHSAADRWALQKQVDAARETLQQLEREANIARVLSGGKHTVELGCIGCSICECDVHLECWGGFEGDSPRDDELQAAELWQELTYGDRKGTECAVTFRCSGNRCECCCVPLNERTDPE